MKPEMETITFVPLQETDLPLLYEWLHEPHVRAWWSDPDTQVDQMRAHLSDDTIEPFVVCLNGEPVAYIQACDLRAAGEMPHLAGLPERTFGIDQFIGPADRVGRGLGTRLVRLMSERLIAQGAESVLVDPAPENKAAIRAYEKAGFARREEIATKHGTALIMTLDRQEF